MIEIVIASIILLVILMAFIKFFKLMLKIALVVLLITIVSVGTLGYFLYKDINDIRTNFQSSTNLVLLTDNTKFIAGAEMSQKQDPVILGQDEINKISDPTQLLNKYYKIIIVNTKSLENILPEKIELEKNIIFTKQELIAAISSDDPLKSINPNLLSLIGKNTKSFNTNDPANIRMLLILSSLKSQAELDPLILIKEYQKGNIKIIEETITFKILKQVPADYIYSKISNIA